ncbi:hypothetical protein [Sphingomonas sp. DC2300-3]|uniref:hypothetical protein n=1 Tax=unclassified Sphingomonas TaxID=196159 RepID=UPI003CE9474C
MGFERLVKRILVALSVLTLQGCDAPERRSEREQMRPTPTQAAAFDNTMADVRLEVAEKRIATLERQVAELQGGTQQVDNDMLKQQLAVSQKALADAAAREVEPTPTPTASPMPAKTAVDRPANRQAPPRRAEPKATSTPSPKPSASPTGRSLKLDLR